MTDEERDLEETTTTLVREGPQEVRETEEKESDKVAEDLKRS